MTGEQSMLSRYDAGDLDDRDLSTTDRDRRGEVEEYAESVTTSGWSLVLVGEDVVAWHNPDGAGVYRLKRKSAGWRGVSGGREVTPSYTEDLQEALDAAGEYLAANPVEEGSR